jgi:hypothetical protein
MSSERQPEPKPDAHARGCPYREEVSAIAQSLGEFFANHPRFEHVEITACIISLRCGCVATISESPEKAIEAARHLTVTAELRQADPRAPFFPRNADRRGGS